MNAEPVAFLNGSMVPASDARLGVSDAGVVLGAAVSEMTRTFHHRPYRLEEHLDRLFSSLKLTGLEAGLSHAKLTEVSEEVVAHNARFLGPREELALIQFITPGEVPIYARMLNRAPRDGPTVCVHTVPLPFGQWARKMKHGAHLVVPSTRHLPPECIDPHVKCRSRMHYFLADREAQQLDQESSALLLDLHGNVTETTVANFFIVDRGLIVSPSLSGTLPGVSRAVVAELAANLDVAFVERDFRLDHALAADEAWISGTPYCLLPVTRLNRAAIGAGKPGPLFRRILQAWSAAVGLDIERQILDGDGP
jgi:branched-subunit amino acid aminotransferase/4-amino-4-deoxychorismate lyase